MGIKKAQTPSHTLYRAYHSPKYPMVESALWCAASMYIWICSLNLVRGRSSCERLSNKKICIPFEMRVTRTVQTECRELALCRGAARWLCLRPARLGQSCKHVGSRCFVRSRTICVQRYAFSMNMDTEFSFFYLYTYLIIYKTMIFDREVLRSVEATRGRATKATQKNSANPKNWCRG